MKRHFTLEAISYEQYNNICPHVQVPPDPSPLSPNPALQPVNWRRVQQKRYFHIVEPTSYRFLSDVLEDIDDDLQQLAFVWPPHNISFGRAEMLTRTAKESYLEEISRNEERYSIIVVGLRKEVKNARNKPGYYTDRFQFNSGNGWTLQRFHIHRPNFPLYELRTNGTHIPWERTPSISGIYD